MLGWLIIVRRSRLDSDAAGGDVLAKWEAGVGGIDWLDALEVEGKAACLSRHGYPNRFHVAAQAVLPYLRAEHPPLNDGLEILGDSYVSPRGWTGPMTVAAELVAACAFGEVWTIDAWDQS